MNIYLVFDILLYTCLFYSMENGIEEGSVRMKWGGGGGKAGCGGV